MDMFTPILLLAAAILEEYLPLIIGGFVFIVFALPFIAPRGASLIISFSIIYFLPSGLYALMAGPEAPTLPISIWLVVCWLAILIVRFQIGWRSAAAIQGAAD